MEASSSGIDTTLLASLRALARRGAALRRDADGGAIVFAADGQARARLDGAALTLANSRAWLTPVAADQFVLSKRGASALRAALARQSALAAAAKPDVGGAPTPDGQPRQRPLSPPPRLPHVNDRESPLAWLRQRRDKQGRPLISQPEYDAGERLRADFNTAQMTPRITASWDMTAPGSRQRRGSPAAQLSVSEAAVAARQRVDIAMRAVGPNLSGVLIDVCCLLQGLEQAERNGGWPKRAGKVVLQIALDGLARHYGLIRPERDGRTPAMRHWGAPDYRPTVGVPGNTDDEVGAPDN